MSRAAAAFYCDIFFHFQENVITAFELNEIYLQCKKNPIRKKNKRDLEKSSKDSDNGHLKSE